MGENTSGPPTFAYMVDEQQMLHDMSEVEAVLTDNGQLGSSHHHPTQVMVGGQLMNLVTTSGHPAGTVHVTNGGRIMLLNSMLGSPQSTVLDGGGRLLTLCGDAGTTTEGGVEVMVLRNTLQQQQPAQQINNSSSSNTTITNNNNSSSSSNMSSTILPSGLTASAIIPSSVGAATGTCYVTPTNTTIVSTTNTGNNNAMATANFTAGTSTTTTSSSGASSSSRSGDVTVFNTSSSVGTASNIVGGASSSSNSRSGDVTVFNTTSSVGTASSIVGGVSSSSRSGDVTVFKRTQALPPKVEVKEEEEEVGGEGGRRKKAVKKAGAGRSVSRRTTASSHKLPRTRPSPFCSPLPTDQSPMVVLPGASASISVPRSSMDELPHTHHLTKSQVEGLFMILGPHYTNPGRRAPLKDFVLASLVLLSTKDSYREMSERMVFKSRGWMHKTIHLFCQMMVKYLSSLIEWPSGEDAKQVVNAFQSIGGIPGVIGAMDTSHMAITKAPVGKSSSLYANPLQFHSIHLMAVSDYRYRFTYVNVGRPGSFHEGKVFKKSSLCQIVDEDPHSIFPVNSHIIAGPGFPLSDYVLTPYPEHHAGAANTLARHQKQFNMKLMHTKKTIDFAFQLLRARWQRLKCLEMQHVSNMSIAIKTCCILHNICLSNPGYEELLVTPEMEEERHLAVDYVGTHPYSAIRKRDMVALYVDGQEAWGGA